MAYPLTGTARTATAVKVSTPVETGVTAVRPTWGRTAFATYPRSAALFVWGSVQGGGAGGSSPPPTTGQLWPRGWR